MRVALLALVAAASIVSSAAAQDVAGSTDHPVTTRYPGSTIQWYHVENYTPYRVPVGPVTGYRAIGEWIDTEGKLTRIYYALEGDERSHSEVYRNYREALGAAGFEILADGLVAPTTRGGPVGSASWRGVFIAANPLQKEGAASNMVAGSASSGGSGAIVARKRQPDGTAYVVVNVYQFRADHVATLVDVLEVAAAETGLVTVDAEAIRTGIEANARVVLDGILFDTDQSTLRVESKAALDEIARYLRDNPGGTFWVVGHTDTQGTLAHNRTLSQARAQAVVDALVRDYGIAVARLEAHGVGPLSPASSNANDAGRERNRRVELVQR